MVRPLRCRGGLRDRPPPRTPADRRDRLRPLDPGPRQGRRGRGPGDADHLHRPATARDAGRSRGRAPAAAARPGPAFGVRRARRRRHPVPRFEPRRGRRQRCRARLLRAPAAPAGGRAGPCPRRVPPRPLPRGLAPARLQRAAPGRLPAPGWRLHADLRQPLGDDADGRRAHRQRAGTAAAPAGRAGEQPVAAQGRLAAQLSSHQVSGRWMPKCAPGSQL